MLNFHRSRHSSVSLLRSNRRLSCSVNIFQRQSWYWDNVGRLEVFKGYFHLYQRLWVISSSDTSFSLNNSDGKLRAKMQEEILYTDLEKFAIQRNVSHCSFQERYCFSKKKIPGRRNLLQKHNICNLQKCHMMTSLELSAI